MNKLEIKKWLKCYAIKNYIINDDLTVDVIGDVLLINKHLKDIPIQFGIVNGYFSCVKNELKSLKGCPRVVKGTFNCWGNPLISLDHLPIIYGNLYCNDRYYNCIEYKRWKMMNRLRK